MSAPIEITPQVSLRKRTKQEVCDAFLANLRARNHPDMIKDGFISGIQQHFHSLPTRYALDVNIHSLDVLNHQKLLESARADPQAVSFQVRRVEVAVVNGYPDMDRRPSFANLDLLARSHEQESHMASSSRPIRQRSLPRPAFGSSPNLQALAAEVERENQEARDKTGMPETEFYEVTVASADQPKLLCKLSEALADLGLNICEAHAFNTVDKLVLDVFVVNGWTTEQDEQELERLLGLRLQALPVPVDQAPPHRQPSEAAIASGASLDKPSLDAEIAETRREDDWELDPADITFSAKIASGAFGDLYRGTYCGQDVAIKILRNVQDDSQQYQEFLQEVSIMRKVRHKNVVQFIGACTRRPNLCIVFEYMPGGSVFDYIKKAGPLRVATVVKFALEVCRGMDYLHKRRIIHRDLKAANLLLDDTGTLKIADFGVARVLEGVGGIMTAETGTYRWMAPEVIEHNPYGEKADVFSFGVVLWELITGEIPYAAMTPLQAAVGVVQKGLRPPIPPTTPPVVADVMRACWQRAPGARPTFEALKGKFEELHEYYAKQDGDGKGGAAGKGGGSFFSKLRSGGGSSKKPGAPQ